VLQCVGAVKMFREIFCVACFVKCCRALKIPNSKIPIHSNILTIIEKECRLFKSFYYLILNTYIYIYIHICTHIHKHTHTHLYTHTHTHTHIHTSILHYTRLNICTHTYIHTSKHLLGGRATLDTSFAKIGIS